MRCVGLWLLRGLLMRGLVEPTVEPTRNDVDPNEHRDVDLIGTLLFKLELIDDGDGSGAEHEVDPDAPKQGRFEQRCESSSV